MNPKNSAGTNAIIAGVGVSIPPKVMTNADFEKLVDTSDEWIRTRTGISERHVAEPGVLTSDLGTEAAQAALKAAGVSAEEIDMIILATFSPDCPFPASACAIQAKLGAKNAAAFDISAACSGFVYGLSIAQQFIKTGAAKKILVIGAEILTSVVDYQDRNTCVLFGDGAGAAVVVPSDDPERGIMATSLGAWGDGFDMLVIPAGGTRLPTSHETIEARDHYIKMKGREVFKTAVQKFQEGIRKAAEGAGWTLDEIDVVVPHQVNTRIIEAIVERIGIAPEKFVQNLERYGNTSAASIPIALNEALGDGRVKKGDKVVFVAVGGGMTWASAAIRW